VASNTKTYEKTEEHGPWRVTTTITRTVERVRQRPKDHVVQPLFEFVNGRPVPTLPGAPGRRDDWKMYDTMFPLHEDRGRRFSVHHMAVITRTPEWKLWAEWLAIHGHAVLPEFMQTPPCRRRRRKGGAA
jgi:hypothetical protein